IAVNLARLRRQRGLSLRQLAQRLAEVGRPMNVDAVNRIEMHKRQVTVPELLALAVVLDVSPMTLLMPSEREPVQLTPAVRTGWRTGWLWAVGELPLTAERVDGGTRAFDRVDLFDPRVAEYIK